MQLADMAAGISRRNFRQNLVINNKPGNFPVTQADLEIETTLRKMIKARYPTHTIIGEEFANESGISAKEYTWVIDPIDGTVAFTTGKPTFTTLIALVSNSTPILGIIDQPILGERFIGINKNGAYLSLTNGNETSRLNSDLSIYQGIQTSKTINPAYARLNASTPDMFTADELYKFDKLKSQVKVCAWGGDAYAYAMLACGQIDLIMESQLQYYDVAALIPIITASGGIITTWDGEPITSDFKGQCLASSNAELQACALKIINN
ncbi:MAG: histidinol phosphate phosphatase [Burkholderiales bacterium]|nr:histidinol phosphate phosphatase [Burkholderiales bacterium]